MNKSQYILQQRKEAYSRDTPELQQRRLKLMKRILVWAYDLEVCEMYPFDCEEGSVKSKPTIPQYFHEFPFANTRTKIKSETRAEIDKLEFEKAVKIICEICLELIRRNIHFAVFYAKGQRSPHIICYDFEQLEELSPFQREKLQAKFWRMIAPWSFQYLDHSIWADEHLLPLEFAPHWKYKTPFNLLFEYLPEVENATTTN